MIPVDCTFKVIASTGIRYFSRILRLPAVPRQGELITVIILIWCTLLCGIGALGGLLDGDYSQ